MWTTWLPVAGMLLVALVFGELASHYPIAHSGKELSVHLRDDAQKPAALRRAKSKAAVTEGKLGLGPAKRP